MNASDNDFTRIYYRTCFDFAHQMIEAYMMYAPDPLIEPIKCEFLKEGGLIQNYAKKGPELVNRPVMNLLQFDSNYECANLDSVFFKQTF